MPLGNPGFMRLVYPGFLQLAGFMAMNLDRHVNAHWQMFLHLVQGDGESLAAKRAFYEEYRSVMDLPAELLPADHLDGVPGASAAARHAGVARPSGRSGGHRDAPRC